MQTATGAAPAQGCYKCGQKGHWSRDCTAPQSQWLPRQPGQQFGGGGAGGGGRPGGGATPGGGPAPAQNQQPSPDGAGNDANDPALAPAGEQGAAAPLRKQQRKRPKLTLELLQGPKGLPDVLVNFPDAFRRQFKGRGHEATDLRRLLEMYKRWQDRVFPHGEFDAFVVNLERLSGTYPVKHHMHDVRMRMLKEVQDIVDPPRLELDLAEEQEQAGGDGGAPAAAAAAGAGAGAAAAAGAGRAAAAWDDEEFDGCELVAEEEEEHPEMEDDELMALLDEEANEGPAGHLPAAGLGAGAAAMQWEGARQQQGEEEEDEFADVELVVEEDSDEEGQQEEAPSAAAAREGPAAGAAPAGPQAAAGTAAEGTAAEGADWMDADEEQQLLAMAADTQQPTRITAPRGVSVATGGAGGAAGPAGMEAEEADAELLALLEEQEAEAAAGQQEGGQPGSTATAAGGALSAGAAPSLPAEPEPSLLEPSLLLGAATEEQQLPGEFVPESEAQEHEAPAGAGTQADARGWGPAAAAEVQPSPLLGAGTEGQGGGHGWQDESEFQASPLLGADTQQQQLAGAGAAFVPESEPVEGTGSQEL